MKTPSEVAEAQLIAYNARDLDSFATCFHESVTAELLVSGQQLFKGMDELRAFYTKRFSNPDLHAYVTHRIALGNVVIDHEEVTGMIPEKTVPVVAIYEIEDEKIKSVRFIREDIN